MSSPFTEAGLMTSMQQAEKDLAMYAAIIGCKPTVEPAAASEPIEVVAPEEEISTAPHNPHRITVWMRHVSDEAKKRIHEARTRLAS